MKGKIFTRDEASRMIPLLRRIATDTKACSRLIERHQAEARSCRESMVQNEADGERVLADHLAKIKSLTAKIDSCRKELEDLGCFLDDAAQGIVKFYGERNSQIIYYTWRLGEPEVSFWHPIEKSFVDRQAIDGDEKVAENAPR